VARSEGSLRKVSRIESVDNTGWLTKKFKHLCRPRRRRSRN
jgi:hypothetical protein